MNLEEYKYKRTFEFLALLKTEYSNNDYFYCEIVKLYYKKNKHNCYKIPYKIIHKRFLEKSLNKDLHFSTEGDLYKVKITLYQKDKEKYFEDYSIEIKNFEYKDIYND